MYCRKFAQVYFGHTWSVVLIVASWSSCHLTTELETRLPILPCSSELSLHWWEGSANSVQMPARTFHRQVCWHFSTTLALSKQSQEDHEFKASNRKFQPFGWKCRRRNPTRWSQISTHAVAHRLNPSFVTITSVQDTHLVKRKDWCEFSFSSFHQKLDLWWGSGAELLIS